MASWLKAAEDLFEVVDRRAKLVVSDLSEEQSESKAPASNGQGSQGKRTKSKLKAHKRLSNPSTVTIDGTTEKTDTPAAPLDVATHRDKVELVAENDGNASISANQPNKEQQPADSTSPLLSTSLLQTLADDVGKHGTDEVKVLAADTDVEVTPVSANGEPAKENASDTHEGDPPPTSKGDEGPSDEPTNTSLTMKTVDSDANQIMDQERPEPVVTDLAPNNDTIIKDGDVKVESAVNTKNEEQHKTDISTQRVQDQLEELLYRLKGCLKQQNLLVSLKRQG